MAHIMDGNNDDPFPHLGSVYRKGSGSPLVKQLSKNGNIAAEGSGPKNSIPSAWGRSTLMHKLGVQTSGNGRTIQNASSENFSSCRNEFSSQQNNKDKQGAKSWNVPTPQVGFPQLNNEEDRIAKDEFSNRRVGSFDADGNDDEVLFVSSDDDDMFDDDSDLEKSHETCKKSKWFNQFFQSMDELTAEEINSPGREWHCPACKGGPGAIDWYRGLEPLMYHAMTRKTRRVKLHRVFTEVLDEETRRRGISVAPVGVAYDRWQGLNGKVKDYEIVWPPMVIIMNTRYEMEDHGKWIGMGNQELLDYFKSYAAVKARHSYGPQGHRGMSVLIFGGTAAGYLEAARLHRHFEDQGRDRDAWNRCRFQFCSGGKRQLCGYMALKEDMEIFNLHCQGKSKLKFEMRSYQEMVGAQIKLLNEDSQELVKVKEEIAKEQKLSQVLAESVSRLSQKLRKSEATNYSMRERTELLLEQKNKELDSQEQFFLDQIKSIRQAINVKEDNFEKLQQAKREKVEQSNANLSTIRDTQRMEDTANFNIQGKEMEEFEAERKRLIKSHEDKKALALIKHWEELVLMEKELENELTQLMEKYNK
ncbi:hypothetical protein JCGZ_05052 [Jatropha curcas]|uniref:XS domain-containing protein n=1 Tax=Jatropha curcas TaxID=180498 RepID=A0A067L319_JATCU|nr:protein SUPPRESSOR OF GENE SILENCING 3 [Jatropha curcas]KDP38895.1 hypothetical protein JCGZ_05052 [Jatropha curcas]